MALAAAAALSAALAQSEALFTLETSRVFAISPYIYGVNFPDWDVMKTRFPFVRMGGNRLTAYNWETNASNAGSDWYNQNDDLMGSTNEAGWAYRAFFQPAQGHGAAPLITIPTQGHVAADKLGGGDVNQTPDYLNVRFKKSLPVKGSAFAYPPNAGDSYVYQDEAVWWIERIKSSSTPVFYALDNEPDLWMYTHSRIQLDNPGYAGILQNNIDFASGIKAQAPASLVFGPVNYGYYGFRAFQGAQDANGRDFLDFYLAGMKSAEAQRGRRLLDVLDIHWYPESQGDGTRIVMNDAGSAGVQEARIQSPRSLWDPNYVETSWITDYLGGRPICLLPGIFGQISAKYPGTKLAISEYNYGGSTHWSGLIAQADVLGVYGRQGVFAASIWGMGSGDTAMLSGFRAYLNYDGHGAKFGSTGMGAAGGDPAKESLYASYEGRKLTAVAINKTASPLPFRIRGSRWLASPKGYVAQAADPFNPKRITVKALGRDLVFTAPERSVVTVEAQL